MVIISVAKPNLLGQLNNFFALCNFELSERIHEFRPKPGEQFSPRHK